MHLKDDASVVDAALHAYMHMLCHVLHIIFDCICMYCVIVASGRALVRCQGCVTASIIILCGHEFILVPMALYREMLKRS